MSKRHQHNKKQNTNKEKQKITRYTTTYVIKIKQNKHHEINKNK